MIINSVK